MFPNTALVTTKLRRKTLISDLPMQYEYVLAFDPTHIPDMNRILSWINDPNKAQSVQEVIIDCRHEAGGISKITLDIEYKIIGVLSQLFLLTDLRRLRLHFRSTYNENLDTDEMKKAEGSIYLKLQVMILKYLVGGFRPENLTSLEITNLIAMPNDLSDNIFQSQEIPAFFSPFKDVTISILSDLRLQSLDGWDALSFWTESLPNILENIPNAMLLDISTNDIESTALMPWDSINMESLTMLSLDGFMFTGKFEGVEAFIHRHRLYSLTLSECSILLNEVDTPRFWSSVYNFLSEQTSGFSRSKLL
ncbi:hypothetical protein BDQ17DRAFT_1429294 [Cyathus striatus]|nr:hypothetical protein BDQ17DRAFT_1429294 [Cyathus striatus]